MGKKSFVLLLSIIMLAFSASLFLSGCGVQMENDGYVKTMVFLGDSITEGFLGSSPLSERDSYAFYAVIGRSNNYRYIESAVSGETVKHMYNHLTGTITADLERQYWVSTADIVHISILGNDMLGGNIADTAKAAAQGDFTRIDSVLLNAAEYFALSIDRIKELNPNVKILVNTLYNPIDAGTNMLTTEDLNEIITLGGGETSVVRNVGTELLNRVNGVIYDYLAAHPGAYDIVDVYTAFNNIYLANYDEGVSLFFGDWLHPSNKGHAVIADTLQTKLIELGLADNDFALPRYKVLRTEQLERLYSNTTADVKSAIKAIKKADSFSEVSNDYFNAIKGIIPDYVNKEIKHRNGELFSDTTTFNVTSAISDGTDYALYADKENSKFNFFSDGTFSLEIVPNPVIIDVANGLIPDLLGEEGFNLEEDFGSWNFATETVVYLQDMWPGLDFHNFQDALARFNTCGLYLEGLDYSSANMIALTESLTACATIPPSFTLPTTTKIAIRGYYCIEQVGEFKQIQMFVGSVSEDGYPFFYSTLLTEDGKTTLEMTIEVAKLTIKAE